MTDFEKLIEKNQLKDLINYKKNSGYIFKNNCIKISGYYGHFIPLFIVSNKKIDYLELKISGSTIIKFPLNFLNKFAKDKLFKTKSKFIYYIPWSMFSNNSISYFNLFYSNIHFYLTSNKIQYPFEAKLYICEHYVPFVERLKLRSSEYCKTGVLKQIQEQLIEIDSCNRLIKLNFKGRIKGIFLDNIDVNNLISFKLYIKNETNGKINVIYNNKEMLSLLTSKITNDCIYVSFDNTSYKTFDCNYNIDFNLHTICIIINSYTKQNIVVRAFNYNKIIYENLTAEIDHSI